MSVWSEIWATEALEVRLPRTAYDSHGAPYPDGYTVHTAVADVQVGGSALDETGRVLARWDVTAYTDDLAMADLGVGTVVGWQGRDYRLAQPPIRETGAGLTDDVVVLHLTAVTEKGQ